MHDAKAILRRGTNAPDPAAARQDSYEVPDHNYVSSGDVTLSKFKSLMWTARVHQRWSDVVRAGTLWLKTSEADPEDLLLHDSIDVPLVHLQIALAYDLDVQHQSAYEHATAAIRGFDEELVVAPDPARALKYLRISLWEASQIAQALGLHSESIAFADRWLEVSDNEILAKESAAASALLSVLRSAHSELGNSDAALQALERKVALLKERAHSQPGRSSVWTELTQPFWELAHEHRVAGNLEASLSVARDWHDSFVSLSPQEGDRTEYHQVFSMGLCMLANTYSLTGDYQAAFNTAQHALKVAQALPQSRQDDPSDLPVLCLPLLCFARHAQELGLPLESLKSFEQAISLLRLPAQLAPHKHGELFQGALAEAANLLTQLDHYEEAAAKEREASEYRDQYMSDNY